MVGIIISAIPYDSGRRIASICKKHINNRQRANLFNLQKKNILTQKACLF
uniref:Uncharacterized protein n=1 Tax=Arundo donax TaxID=35708 RepID=A0A0A8YWK6_ARUDO